MSSGIVNLSELAMQSRRQAAQGHGEANSGSGGGRKTETDRSPSQAAAQQHGASSVQGIPRTGSFVINGSTGVVQQGVAGTTFTGFFKKISGGSARTEGVHVRDGIAGDADGDGKHDGTEEEGEKTGVGAKNGIHAGAGQAYGGKGVPAHVGGKYVYAVHGRNHHTQETEGGPGMQQVAGKGRNSGRNAHLRGMGGGARGSTSEWAHGHVNAGDDRWPYTMANVHGEQRTSGMEEHHLLGSEYDDDDVLRSLPTDLPLYVSTSEDTESQLTMDGMGRVTTSMIEERMNTPSELYVMSPYGNIRREVVGGGQGQGQSVRVVYGHDHSQPSHQEHMYSNSNGRGANHHRQNHHNQHTHEDFTIDEHEVAAYFPASPTEEEELMAKHSFDIGGGQTSNFTMGGSTSTSKTKKNKGSKKKHSRNHNHNHQSAHTGQPLTVQQALQAAKMRQTMQMEALNRNQPLYIDQTMDRDRFNPQQAAAPTRREESQREAGEHGQAHQQTKQEGSHETVVVSAENVTPTKREAIHTEEEDDDDDDGSWGYDDNARDGTYGEKPKRKKARRSSSGKKRNGGGAAAGRKSYAQVGMDDATARAAALRNKRRMAFTKEVTYKLRRWLYYHVDKPYPTEAEKVELMENTDLELIQINNWFINARRRTLNTLRKLSEMKGGEALTQQEEEKYLWP